MGAATGLVFEGEELVGTLAGELDEGVDERDPGEQVAVQERPRVPQLILSTESLAVVPVLRAGQILYVRAQGFAPGPLVLELDGRALEKARADESGGFVIKLAIPEGLKLGQHRVRVKGKGEQVAVALFGTTDAEDRVGCKKRPTMSWAPAPT